MGKKRVGGYTGKGFELLIRPSYILIEHWMCVFALSMLQVLIQIALNDWG